MTARTVTPAEAVEHAEGMARLHAQAAESTSEDLRRARLRALSAEDECRDLRVRLETARSYVASLDHTADCGSETGDDGAPCDCSVGAVAAILETPVTDDVRDLAAARAAVATMRESVDDHRERLRSWQDAAADATTLRVRAESDRDAALAHAAELESALRAAREDADRETRWLGVVRETAEREALDTIALRAAACTLLDALAEERRAWSAPLSGLPLPRYGGGPAETAAREVAEAAMRALAGVPDAR